MLCIHRTGRCRRRGWFRIRKCSFRLMAMGMRLRALDYTMERSYPRCWPHCSRMSIIQQGLRLCVSAITCPLLLKWYLFFLWCFHHRWKPISHGPGKPRRPTLSPDVASRNTRRIPTSLCLCFAIAGLSPCALENQNWLRSLNFAFLPFFATVVPHPDPWDVAVELAGYSEASPSPSLRPCPV